MIKLVLRAAKSRGGQSPGGVQEVQGVAPAHSGGLGIPKGASAFDEVGGLHVDHLGRSRALGEATDRHLQAGSTSRDQKAFAAPAAQEAPAWVTRLQSVDIYTLAG